MQFGSRYAEMVLFQDLDQFSHRHIRLIYLLAVFSGKQNSYPIVVRVATGSCAQIKPISHTKILLGLISL